MNFFEKVEFLKLQLWVTFFWKEREILERLPFHGTNVVSLPSSLLNSIISTRSATSDSLSFLLSFVCMWGLDIMTPFLSLSPYSWTLSLLSKYIVPSLFISLLLLLLSFQQFNHCNSILFIPHESSVQELSTTRSHLSTKFYDKWQKVATYHRTQYLQSLMIF